MKYSAAINLGMALFLSVISIHANASIALDRTRVVFPGGEKSVSMTVANENKQLPYLAQGWVENEKGEKISSPFIVLPPVQRVEPGAKTQVKIQATAGLSALPRDRESIYYFNLREIPPRSNKPNVLQLALQTKIKLFYRPEALLQPENATPWQESLTLERKGDRFIVHNPTGYYATIIDAHAKGTKAASKFHALMVSPKSDADLGVAAASLGSSPQIVYINDFGGRPVLTFGCAGSSCKVVSTKTSE
ncbi:MAG TPA: fimbria/pilus periplasmic chaperone [Buttiauxella sp.]|jgi:P pilus assembly chaperone PapD